MKNASENLRGCPTRDDGVEVLIAHSISTEVCAERQRRLYHKCFTCTHRGERATMTVKPQRTTGPRLLAREPNDELARAKGASRAARA